MCFPKVVTCYCSYLCFIFCVVSFLLMQYVCKECYAQLPLRLDFAFGKCIALLQQNLCYNYTLFIAILRGSIVYYGGSITTISVTARHRIYLSFFCIFMRFEVQIDILVTCDLDLGFQSRLYYHNWTYVCQYPECAGGECSFYVQLIIRGE